MQHEAFSLQTSVKTETTILSTIDEYIATFPSEVRTILTQIRETIQEAAPQAEERISYRMPSFSLDGPLVYFAAFKSHIGFYPPVGDPQVKAEAARYAGERGNLRFPLDEPIPYELVRKIVLARVRENRERVESKTARARSKRSKSGKSAVQGADSVKV